MRACKLQVFSFLSLQNNDGLAQEEDSNSVLGYSNTTSKRIWYNCQIIFLQ